MSKKQKITYARAKYVGPSTNGLWMKFESGREFRFRKDILMVYQLTEDEARECQDAKRMDGDGNIHPIFEVQFFTEVVAVTDNAPVTDPLVLTSALREHELKAVCEALDVTLTFGTNQRGMRRSLREWARQYPEGEEAAMEAVRLFLDPNKRERQLKRLGDTLLDGAKAVVGKITTEPKKKAKPAKSKSKGSTKKTTSKKKKGRKK